MGNENEKKKLNEEEDDEPKILVFTVLKNGAILKNIFIVNKPPPPPTNKPISSVHQQTQEEILIVSRHCNIVLTHPNISRFHLQILSNPSSQKLSLTDLSSVHGTWVSEKRLEPGVRVELREGHTLRVGGSSRVYSLHWIPLSRAYDFETPFVPLTNNDEDKNAEGVFQYVLMDDRGAVYKILIVVGYRQFNNLELEMPYPRGALHRALTIFKNLKGMARDSLVEYVTRSL